MKRTMYLFIIIISIFAFAIVCREFIARNNEQTNDSCHIPYVRDMKMDDQIVQVPYTKLMGGIVIDSTSGFDHRFFYVSVYNRYVAIFNGCGSLCYETGIPLEYVDSALRKCIIKGIYFEDIVEAKRFVELLRYGED